MCNELNQGTSWLEFVPHFLYLSHSIQPKAVQRKDSHRNPTAISSECHSGVL